MLLYIDLVNGLWSLLAYIGWRAKQKLNVNIALRDRSMVRLYVFAGMQSASRAVRNAKGD
jgi:hypothetical protein